MDVSGKYQIKSINETYKAGTTLRELLERTQNFKPDDLYAAEEFSGWGLSSTGIDLDEKLDGWSTLFFIAEYQGKTIINIDKTYAGQISLNDHTTIFADGEDLDEETIKKLLPKENPVLPHGLTFKEWEIYMDKEGKSYVSVIMRAVQNECILMMGEAEIYKIVQPGEEVMLPSEWKNHKNLEWRNEKGEIITDISKPIVAESGMILYAFGDDEPEEPDKPTESDKPTIELPDEVIEDVVNRIEDENNKASVVVNMNGAMVVPKEVLEAAKGKDVDIVLDMGGYSWTINGKDIKADNLKDINLEVKMDTNAIAPSFIEEIAGGLPTRQLSLTHNGDFGFKARLTINVGAEYSGQYGNLYYYDSNHKLVFQNAGKILADGTVSLEFSHASDYVIVIGKEVTQEAKPPVVIQPDTNYKPQSTADTTQIISPKTGDTTSVVPFVIGIVGILLVCVGLIKRKRISK